MTFFSFCLSTETLTFLEAGQARKMTIQQALGSDAACDSLPSDVLTLITLKAARSVRKPQK